VAVVPPLAIVRLVLRYARDVPVLDQWDLVPLLKADQAGALGVGELWAPHNEHRLFLSRAVLVGLARMTAWDTRAELVVSLLLAGLTLLLLGRLIVGTVREAAWPLTPALLPLASALVFSVGAWENWLWGWNVQILMAITAAVLAVHTLAGSGRPWLRLAGALLAAVGAALSYGNGLLVLLVVPLGWALMRDDAGGRGRGAGLGVALAVALLVLGVYLRGLPTAGAGVLLAHPGAIARYTLAYLGGNFALGSSTGAVWFGAAGLLALAAITPSVWQADPAPRRTLVPWLLLAFYAVGSAGLTAVSRAPVFGAGQALTSRYVSVAALFWLALAVLATLAIARCLGRHGVRSRRATLALVATGFALLVLGVATAVSWRHTLGGTLQYHALQVTGERCLLEYRPPPDVCLQLLHYDVAAMRDRVAWLAGARLSLFADRRGLRTR
jgi:hypothetical protein